MNKPKYRMKTVIKAAEKCMEEGPAACPKCLYKPEPLCARQLTKDMVYYLRQALEKSERKK